MRHIISKLILFVVMNSEPLYQTLGFLLHDAARLMRKRFEQKARHLGLTRSQWQVLAHVARNEGIQQSALADMLDIEPITLVRLVDRLEAAGFLERRLHAKYRRVRQLFLTEKAHPVLVEMRALGQATRDDALVGVPSEDRERLTETLLAIRANLVRACNDGVEAVQE